MTSIHEKGGGTFECIKLLLCENPLPPIEEAIAAAQAEVPRSNYYTEPFSPISHPMTRLAWPTGFENAASSLRH
jgi:histidinol-phosphate/aromatic aminotransferase/cobyric acid decarboxylase-like protein